MKRLAILAIFILALVSQACQRKQYALFDDLSTSSYLYQQKSSPAVIGELSPFADADTTGTLIEKRQVVVSQPGFALLKEENPQRASTKKKQIKAGKLSEQKAKFLFHGKADKPKSHLSKVQGIASLVYGSIGLLMVLLFSFEFINVVGLLLSIVLGTIGLLLGVVSLFRIGKGAAKPSRSTAAIIGIILSVGSIVLTTIILSLSK